MWGRSIQLGSEHPSDGRGGRGEERRKGGRKERKEGGRRARGGRRNKEKDGGRKTSERGRGEEGVWVGERDRRMKKG